MKVLRHIGLLALVLLVVNASSASDEKLASREKGMNSLSGGAIIPFGMCSKKSSQKNREAGGVKFIPYL